MVSTQSEPTLTLAEARRRPPQERLPYLAHLPFIPYAQGEAILEQIALRHRLSKLGAGGQALALLGRVRVGKTALLEVYRQHNQPSAEAEDVRSPVIRVVPPAATTLPTLVNQFLAAADYRPTAGQPAAARSTTWLEAFEERGVEVIYLDSIDMLTSAPPGKQLVVLDWLKSAIEESSFTWVLVGTTGRAGRLLSVHPGLAALCGRPLVLAPFDRRENTPAGVGSFGDFLAQLETVLPFNEPSDLTEPDLAAGCFVACEGMIGDLVELVRRASYLALVTGQEHLNRELLARAFAGPHLEGREREPNPFVDVRPRPAGLPGADGRQESREHHGNTTGGA